MDLAHVRPSTDNKIWNDKNESAGHLKEME